LAPAPPSQTATPTASAFTVSEKAICTLLIGPGEDGPLIQYINGITNIDTTDKTGLADLVTTQYEIEKIAKRATQRSCSWRSSLRT
jgi:hypothetical protein